MTTPHWDQTYAGQQTWSANPGSSGKGGPPPQTPWYDLPLQLSSTTEAQRAAARMRDQYIADPGLYQRQQEELTARQRMTPYTWERHVPPTEPAAEPEALHAQLPSETRINTLPKPVPPVPPAQPPTGVTSSNGSRPDTLEEAQLQALGVSNLSHRGCGAGATDSTLQEDYYSGDSERESVSATSQAVTPPATGETSQEFKRQREQLMTVVDAVRACLEATTTLSKPLAERLQPPLVAAEKEALRLATRPFADWMVQSSDLQRSNRPPPTRPTPSMPPTIRTRTEKSMELTQWLRHTTRPGYQWHPIVEAAEVTGMSIQEVRDTATGNHRLTIQEHEGVVYIKANRSERSSGSRY